MHSSGTERGRNTLHSTNSESILPNARIGHLAKILRTGKSSGTDTDPCCEQIKEIGTEDCLAATVFLWLVT